MRLDHVMNRPILSSTVLGAALLLGSLLAPLSAAAAGPISSTACAAVGTDVTCTLWAKPGSLSLPGNSATIWGFSESAGGSPVVPGPTLIVTQGDHVTVNLTNQLSQPTSILFGGQAMVPDQAGIAPGASDQYEFTASQPGTYLYEAGMIPGSQYQAAMGLHGVLIVRPSGRRSRPMATPRPRSTTRPCRRSARSTRRSTTARRHGRSTFARTTRSTS